MWYQHNQQKWYRYSSNSYPELTEDTMFWVSSWSSINSVERPSSVYSWHTHLIATLRFLDGTSRKECLKFITLSHIKQRCQSFGKIWLWVVTQLLAILHTHSHRKWSFPHSCQPFIYRSGLIQHGPSMGILISVFIFIICQICADWHTKWSQAVAETHFHDWITKPLNVKPRRTE